MAENGGAPRTLVEITATPSVHAGSLRDKPAGICSNTGRMPLNTGGTDLVEEVARERNLKKGKYLIKYYVDPEAKSVVAVPVPAGTAMAMPIRRHKNNLVLYLQGVLETYPHVKGPGRRLCMLIKDVDAEGKPAVLMPLGAALTPPSQRRERETAAAPAPDRGVVQE